MSKEFSKVTISLDGLFFDDGTFLGADTIGFFNEVKSQMDARYEIISEVENGVKSGANVDGILRKLEQIASQPMPDLGESPSRSEYMNSFRILIAKDILGMKAVFGTKKAIEDVHQQALGIPAEALAASELDGFLWGKIHPSQQLCEPRVIT